MSMAFILLQMWADRNLDSFVCTFLGPCCCVVDAGGQRQEGIASPGTGALQSTEEQEYTCQVHTHINIKYIHSRIKYNAVVLRFL